MKVMTTLGELCENETSKAVVEAIQDMLFDLDTDEYDEEYIAEYAERIDEIIVNG
mgnify:CR=1 FL=1